MRRYMSVFLVLVTLMLVGSVRADTTAPTPPPPEPAVNPRYFLPTLGNTSMPGPAANSRTSLSPLR